MNKNRHTEPPDDWLFTAHCSRLGILSKFVVLMGPWTPSISTSKPEHDEKACRETNKNVEESAPWRRTAKARTCVGALILFLVWGFRPPERPSSFPASLSLIAQFSGLCGQPGCSPSFVWVCRWEDGCTLWGASPSSRRHPAFADGWGWILYLCVGGEDEGRTSDWLHQHEKQPPRWLHHLRAISWARASFSFANCRSPLRTQNTHNHVFYWF